MQDGLRVVGMDSDLTRALINASEAARLGEASRLLACICHTTAAAKCL